MGLYKISENIVIEALRSEELVGKQWIVKHTAGFRYPLKIVFNADATGITVITAYPLKRGL